MSIEFGHYALWLALAFALAQCVLSAVGAARANAALRLSAARAAQMQCALLFLCLCILAFAFLRSDFSLVLAATHGHSTKPALYQIAAVWGNHEGSMLLWVFFLSVVSAFFAGSAKRADAPAIAPLALAVQGGVGVLFLLFILITSNPFLRFADAPFQGAGLNPILQDIALAFHPPILYAGYVGYSIVFSLAVAALLDKNADGHWAARARPYALFAWSALTAGIALGAWWAYRELGWGGFWFWDPVENAALMPWLAGTGLLHALALVRRDGAHAGWALFLALLAFSLSLLGTFLTRSGLLVSVHSFASDPTRGIFIFTILAFVCGSAFALFATRVGRLRKVATFAPISREAALLVNSVIIAASSAMLLIGTLYPLILDSLGGARISVGPPYFNTSVVPLMAALFLLIPAGPFLNWRRADMASVARALRLAAAGALIVFALVYAFALPRTLGAAAGLALAAWLVGGALTRAWHRRTLREAGMCLAHGGLGVLVAGITGVSAWQVEHTGAYRAGDTMSVAGYTLRVQSIEPFQGPDFRGTLAEVAVIKNDAVLARLAPETRRYIARTAETHEADVYHALFPLADMYVVLGDETDAGARVIKVYYNPLAVLLWLGAGLMALGGLVALFVRLGASWTRIRSPALAAFMLVMMLSAPARALGPDEPLRDPALETRARDVIGALQCLVCSGQPLAQSGAPLAVDLRRLIRQRVAAGESHDAIIAFVQARYGDVVLLSPPLNRSGWALWALPFGVLLGAGILLGRALRAAGAREKNR